jgi:GNAT superfamily N-acetyltransferase
MTIRALSAVAVAERAGLVSAIEEIFFLSSPSGGTLAGAERGEFFRRWTGYYLDQETEFCLLYDEGGRVLGYLTGCAASHDAARLFDDLFYYAAFADFHDAYPAHFHVNVHPDARGQGVGAVLVEKFATQVGTAVHLVTAPGARNVRFYDRLGFATVAMRRVDGRDLVMLGRNLK